MLYRLSALALVADTYAATIPGGGVWGQPRGGPNVARPSVPGEQHWHGQGLSAGSPKYDYIFEVPLPQGTVAKPSYSTEINGVPIDYYEVTIEGFTQQVYPELGPAHLIGYNGSAPGPTFWVERGRETIIRYLNKGNVSAAVHLHGSYTHAAWDGWALDEMEVGEWKDYYYPNTENARPIWYHDHADGHTASDAYYGQAGVYIIYDPAEDYLGLPSGEHDLQLALSDKTYTSDGNLKSPGDNALNFFGDIIHVNEQPWPYKEVEPRKYRLRFFDMSLSRPYDLYLVDPEGNWLDFQVIASDSGLFEHPVDSKDLTIACGERYEIVVDFAKYAGKNITLANKMKNPMIDEYDNTDKVMRFVVGKSAGDSSNNGDVPSTLNGNIQWPEKRTTVDHVFNFQMGGDNTWTINGVDFYDVNNRILARPPQGTVELWELRHTGGPGVHPVHIHLVNLQVVSRSGGNRGLLPYETAGLKDVVLLEPGEIVQVLAYYGPWNGLYMFHCHNLVHEDHAMMDAFNVSRLNELGYEFNDTLSYGDPLDTRFKPQAYSEEAYSPEAVHSAVSVLGALKAYSPASSIMAAESSHYATAGYHGEPSTGAQKATVAPSSSGYGFQTSTTAEFAPGFTMATPSMIVPSTFPSKTTASNTTPSSTSTSTTAPSSTTISHTFQSSSIPSTSTIPSSISHSSVLTLSIVSSSISHHSATISSTIPSDTTNPSAISLDASESVCTAASVTVTEIVTPGTIAPVMTSTSSVPRQNHWTTLTKSTSVPSPSVDHSKPSSSNASDSNSEPHDSVHSYGENKQQDRKGQHSEHKQSGGPWRLFKF